MGKVSVFEIEISVTVTKAVSSICKPDLLICPFPNFGRDLRAELVRRSLEDSEGVGAPILVALLPDGRRASSIPTANYNIALIHNSDFDPDINRSDHIWF